MLRFIKFFLHIKPNRSIHDNSAVFPSPTPAVITYEDDKTIPSSEPPSTLRATVGGMLSRRFLFPEHATREKTGQYSSKLLREIKFANRYWEENRFTDMNTIYPDRSANLEAFNCPVDYTVEVPLRDQSPMRVQVRVIESKSTDASSMARHTHFYVPGRDAHPNTNVEAVDAQMTSFRTSGGMDSKAVRIVVLNGNSLSHVPTCLAQAGEVFAKTFRALRTHFRVDTSSLHAHSLGTILAGEGLVRLHAAERPQYILLDRGPRSLQLASRNMGLKGKFVFPVQALEVGQQMLRGIYKYSHKALVSL